MTVKRLTRAAAIKQAKRYIASGHRYVTDFCAVHGQIFENVKRTQWLLDYLVEELIADNEALREVKR